jgi:hypothetical protein
MEDPGTASLPAHLACGGQECCGGFVASGRLAGGRSAEAGGRSVMPALSFAHTGGAARSRGGWAPALSRSPFGAARAALAWARRWRRVARGWGFAVELCNGGHARMPAATLHRPRGRMQPKRFSKGGATARATGFTAR